MILNNKVAEKFKSLLAALPSWNELVRSQFVQHLAIGIGWLHEEASFKVERARQEAFIDTALNRSSILAHGEGREYIPRKPTPSRGRILMSNSGDESVTLLRGRELSSDSQLPYTLEDTIVIPANATATAGIVQQGKTSLTFTIELEKPFYEILFDRDLSATIMEIGVFIDEGNGFTRWEYDRLFTNAYTDSRVWDEFYHVTDQVGIRFGNGTFGRIPRQGASVRVDLTLTNGDTLLLERQYLYPVETIVLKNGLAANIQIEVSETVQGGGAQEPTEEMRRNLHYWPIYNERLIWDNDYTYFLRRRYPEIVFVRAWGEEEAEKLWGTRIEHINKIWISAYAPREGVQEDVMAVIAEVPMMCRNFKWYEPEHVPFTMKLTGRVLRDRVLSDVREEVLTALRAAYGRDSTSRREVVRLHEVYECIYATGHFDKTTGAWFEVSLEGAYAAEKIYQMVSLDFDGSSIAIEYL